MKANEPLYSKPKVSGYEHINSRVFYEFLSIIIIGLIIELINITTGYFSWSVYE